MIILAVAALLLLTGVLTTPRQVEALHDQGNICYTCHSLNPAELRSGSNSIRLDQAVLATIPPSDTPWVGGMPVTCDFCHRAATDIPKANMADKVGAGGSKHPVDTILTGDNTTNPREITCNDCHDNATQDLVSLTLQTKNASDGYPDHKSVVDNYVHNLTLNPPHLSASWPYWGASLPGVNRTADGTFWSAVQTGGPLLCWRCHDGVTTAPYTTGVRSLVNIKSEYTGTGDVKGHKIQSVIAGGLSQGSALPCYDCHDSHGSVSKSLILDNNSIYNDCTSLLAVTTFTGANDRVVCAGCHDTNNTITGTTKAGGIATMVEGMYPIDPWNSPTTSALHISGGVTTVMTGGQNCLSGNGGCHANPHNPMGESNGGMACATCHSEYTSMRSTTTYQHVMYDNGMLYPNTAPTSSGTDLNRQCVMCHVDHNIFRKDLNASSKGRGGNLRTRILDNNITATLYYDNTDFNIATTNGGICLSCHLPATQFTKNTTNQKAGFAATQVVTPSPAIFDNSAHKYAVNTTFTADGSGFAGVCAKCHNSNLGSSFNSLSFSMHNATSGQLLAQFGRTVAVDNLEQLFCYGCHSQVGNLTAALGGKALNGRDWYGNPAGAVMTTASEKTWTNFNLTSKHPLSGNHTTTPSVECENCHNPHIVRTLAGSRVVNPDNTLALIAYATVADNVAFCLKCHDGAPPAYRNAVDNLVPYAVIIPVADNALMNKTANQARAHWNVAVPGSFQASTTKACSACHDNHGSTALKLLGTFDPATNTSKVYGTQATVTLYNSAAPTAADNASVCSACHQNEGLGYPVAGNPSLASIMTFEGYRLTSATPGDNGYFSPTPSGSLTTPRWPGTTVWQNATYSPHGVSVKTGPATLGSRGVADCNGCHDVHGTRYKFNQLTDNMAAGNYKLCFDCHDGVSVAGTSNIKRYFPTAVGGAWTANDNNHGHRIQSPGGKLPVGTALPCYDCHVTHGSKKNNLNLVSDQRWNNLADTLTNDNASRVFCLGCHTTSDATPRDGYGLTVTATDTIEGLNRIAKSPLRLPNTVPGHLYANTSSCRGCHYSASPYADNTTNNAHNPNSGSCSGCHGDGGTRIWPQNAGNLRDGALANYNDAGEHLAHLTDLAARLGYSTDNSTWADNQAVMCAYCHDYNGDTVNPHMATGAGKLAQVFNTVSGRKNFKGGLDNNATWNVGTFSCTNVDCHNSQNTTATYGWYSGSASTCVMCHNTLSKYPAGFDNNPRSGLHSVTSAGVTKHDNTLGGGSIGCTRCHWTTGVPAHTPSSTHIDNVVNAANTTINRVGMTFFDCTVNRDRGSCQGLAGLPATGCHTDGGAWKRLWTVEADNIVSTTAESPRCNGCHGKWSGWPNSAGWRDNTTHFNMGGGGDNGVGHDNVVNSCNNCHAYTSVTGRHDNGVLYRINVNNQGTTAYARTGNTPGSTATCTKCHAAATKYNYPISVFLSEPVSGVVIPNLPCTGCHYVGSISAPPVGATSTHVRVTPAAGFTTCEACHAGHVGATGGVDIPLPSTSWNNNNPGDGAGNINVRSQLGLNFPSHTGIHLGGDCTVGTTEAQICWYCHTTTNATARISEFSVNNSTSTGSFSYNYGQLCKDNTTAACDNGASNAQWEPDWTKAFWRSGQDTATPSFSYKRGRIQSTHAANPGIGVSAVTGTGYRRSEAVDCVANIRCSYCHDVHELGLAVGDTKAGGPYLRGTWRGNPYKEDGAPMAGQTFTSFNKYSSVPRGGTQYTQMGGYFIAQNTPVNDNTATQANFAGLCNLCHNTTASAVGIDNMDMTTGEALWIGNNGHSATVNGGNASPAADILDFTHGRPTPVNGRRVLGTQVASMGLVGAQSVGGYSYRSSNYGGSYVPTLTGMPWAMRSYNWGASVSPNALNSKYHKFTCAKCHNPHASRLPKLMITNCLDVRHNTWQVGKSAQSLYTAPALTDRGRLTAYYNSAQNCHRYDDNNAFGGQGWNKVTPW